MGEGSADVQLGAGRHLVLIAACDEAGGIGRRGSIPWDYPEDRAFFRRQTTGHPVIMGRKTYESLPQRPLNGRFCGVWTHRKNYDLSGKIDFDEDLHALIERGFCLSDIVYGAGGGAAYRAMLPSATEMLITRIPGLWSCDVFFPDITNAWKCTEMRRIGTICIETWHKSQYAWDKT